MGTKTVKDFDMLALSYHLKKNPLYDGMHVEFMDPDWISITPEDGLPTVRGSSPTIRDCEATAPYLTDVCDRIMQDENIEDIMKEDSPVGRAAICYFKPENMALAGVHGGDDIRLDGRGINHVIAAAKQKAPLPVYSIMEPEDDFVKQMEAAEKYHDHPLDIEDPDWMRDDYSDVFEKQTPRRLPWLSSSDVSSELEVE